MFTLFLSLIDIRTREDCLKIYYELNQFKIPVTNPDRLTTQVHIKPTQHPTAVVKYSPKVTLIEFVSQLGGIFGIWFGASAYGSLHMLHNLYKRFKIKMSISENSNTPKQSPEKAKLEAANLESRRRPYGGTLFNRVRPHPVDMRSRRQAVSSFMTHRSPPSWLYDNRKGPEKEKIWNIEVHELQRYPSNRFKSQGPKPNVLPYASPSRRNPYPSKRLVIGKW